MNAHSQSNRETCLNDNLTDVGAYHTGRGQLQHLVIVTSHTCHDRTVRDVHHGIDHAQHGIADGRIDDLRGHVPFCCLRKHQQARSDGQWNTTIKEISTILTQLGIAVIDVTSHDRTPETVDESNRENQSTNKSRINFQYRSQVDHQVTCHRLEDQVLSQVTRTITNALKPAEFVEAVSSLS